MTFSEIDEAVAMDRVHEKVLKYRNNNNNSQNTNKDSSGDNTPKSEK